jgi:hypothetical protein
MRINPGLAILRFALCAGHSLSLHCHTADKQRERLHQPTSFYNKDVHRMMLLV